MAVGFMRWLQCADTIQTADGIAVAIRNDVTAPLLRQEFTLFRVGIATDAGGWEHQQMIETTCCTRDNVRMRGTTESR